MTFHFIPPSPPFSPVHGSRVHQPTPANNSASAASAGPAGSSAGKPLLSKCHYTIFGGTSIRQYHILNNKRHIVTKDTDSNVAVYDVLKAQKVEDLGKVDFDEEVKRRFEVRDI